MVSENLTLAVTHACLGTWEPLRSVMHEYGSAVLLGGSDQGWKHFPSGLQMESARLLKASRHDVLQRWLNEGLPIEAIRGAYVQVREPAFLPALDAAIALFGLDSATTTELLTPAYAAVRVGSERALAWCRSAPASSAAIRRLFEILAPARNDFPSVTDWYALVPFLTARNDRNAFERLIVKHRSDGELAAARTALGEQGDCVDSLAANAMEGNKPDEVLRLLSNARRGPAFLCRLFLRGVRADATASLVALVKSCPCDYWTPRNIKAFVELAEGRRSYRDSLEEGDRMERAVVDRWRGAGLIHDASFNEAAVRECHSKTAGLFVIRHQLCSSPDLVRHIFTKCVKYYANRPYVLAETEVFARTFGSHSPLFRAIPKDEFLTIARSFHACREFTSSACRLLYGEELPRSW